MSGPMDGLPRLSALRMFEVAARHLSFTAAARELQVTQAAVSQQVRALERELGVALFRRLHRGLRLTPEGARLQRTVAMAFEQLASTALALQQCDHGKEIAIGATFAVATFWLVPRLARFRAENPDIDVHVVATDRGFDKIAEQMDAGIAYGTGDWPGLTATLLRAGKVFPVCSPHYLARRPPITSIEQLQDEALLALDDDRPGLFSWALWFSEHGITRSGAVRDVTFNSHPLLLQAACEGQGVALGWNLLTDDLIEQGKLVQLLDASLATPRGFYLVQPVGRRSRAVERFRQWVLAQFDAGHAPGAGRDS